MTILVASDLHLAPERPGQTAMFQALMAAAGETASAVFLLGDLVEFWLGDDDDTPLHRTLVAILAALTARGVAVHVLPGNRDFLFGSAFCAQTGVVLLPDYHVLDLADRRTVLTHGDLLCTKDVKYQAFRAFVRDPAQQAAFLAQPIARRREIARQTRTGTTASMLDKDEYIMDVDEDAVRTVLREHAAECLVHGHTHRPGVHEFTLDGRACRRIVLGDWYEAGRILICDGANLTLMQPEDYLAERGAGRAFSRARASRE